MRRLKQLIRLAYHLMLVNQLLAGRRLQEIEAAILAAAALAAYCGDNVARRIDAERIARKLVYPPDEIHHEYFLAPLVAKRLNHGIGVNHHITAIEKIAVNPIHYHPVASLQLRGKTSRRHREDSEGKGSYHPHQEQRQT